MTPLKVSYTVGGKERGSVVAEDDGTTAVLDTPAGRATASIERIEAVGKIMHGASKLARTNFPGDEMPVNIYPRGSAATKPFSFGKLVISQGSKSERKKEYKTEEGNVVIEAECY